MSLIMWVKNVLRRSGYDVVHYHSLYETVLKPLGIKTVLDIGANTGAYAKEMRALFPYAHIHSFEPLSDCFAELKKALPNDHTFTAYNIGLGDSNTESTIEKSSFHPSSSLLPMATLHKELYPKSAASTTEKIQICTLDSLAPSLSIEGPALIKIDVQGFEDKVITGGRMVMKDASIVICETSFVQLYEGQPLFDDIYAMLRTLGFVYYGSAARHYSKRTNTLIYEDAIFIKPELIRA